ncbi:hypothetical protein H257_15718 [Aphanomyces astaci]|uniref:Helicase-associated domain-containing protein n=1 Tax=Aphanomyces astaci TaxID=112090 RepID=W4FL62_APHAT|nr:hypothetical protein H257_15718 [Aphanomyces astaci]ETV68262.1 hypothetical protein H257_15718 [Aphanomyces astaci]RHY05237.1 hypothetical protein DYB25_010280 [Aphanomyces astaci]RHY82252.1 hypothetical protein DYB31_005702 [Aphanomyces astaci]RQM26069.1 hypothetical protein B5M09_011899 [Aphanomyces astaci]|eukprot:XP_009842205.1 hypothetical protein H257_15718 [Aphanomyces astaci]
MPRPRISKASIGYLLNAPFVDMHAKCSQGGGGYKMALDTQHVFCRVAHVIHTDKLALSRYNIVPCKFKVPHSELYPPHLRGFTLNFGAFRHAHKRHRLDPAVVASLDAIGFVWDAAQHKWELQLLCLQLYKLQHGHTNVPRAFDIPSTDAWPTHLWGLPLGVMVNDLRKAMNTLAPPKLALLDALGFAWNAHDVIWTRQLAAVTTYAALYGHTNVPRMFVVPTSDPWPQDTWAMKLGFVVHNLRTKASGLARERKAHLDRLGFHWDARWSRPRTDATTLTSIEIVEV